MTLYEHNVKSDLVHLCHMGNVASLHSWKTDLETEDSLLVALNDQNGSTGELLLFDFEYEHMEMWQILKYFSLSFMRFCLKIKYYFKEYI